MPEKVVIIGSGPAGWTAAIYAARANLEPLVFEGAVTEPNRLNSVLPLGQLNLTTEVENFPAWPFTDSAALQQFAKSALPGDRYNNVAHLYEGKRAHQGKRAATGPELMEFMRQQALNFGTRIITDDIVKVDFQRHPFVLTAHEGGTTEALAVIIATGAAGQLPRLAVGGPLQEQRRLGLCGLRCALPRFRNKPLIVIGGGDSAVEEATYLTKFASQVHLVVRRNELRASKIMQKRALDNPKITMKWNRVLDEVLGNDQTGVTAARLKSTTDASTETLDISGLFLAIGHTPNTDFLAGQLQVDAKGYVIWTKPQRTFTSVEGVFAAGDVADNYYRQAVTAAGTGCQSALDAERWLAEKGYH